MPYWRISGFYFFYFAVLGVLVPYWGLYLQWLGFTPAQIGSLGGVMMISRIVAPNVWGWIADHTSRRLTVVRVASLLTVIAFAGAFFGTSFWWLAAVMLVFSFFWHASLPVLEVLTMNYLGARPGAYGRVRLWGSIGFIVSVITLGPVVDGFGPWWVVPTLFGLMFSMWLSSLLFDDAKLTERVEHPGPFLKLLLRPEVIAFLVAGVFMQISHGPYYTFYSIYLESHGYSKTVIGVLWAFAVLCEIGIFIVMSRLLRRFTLQRMLAFSFLLATARWLLIGFFVESMALLVVSQILHAATFGLFHAVGMQFIYKFFTGRHQHRGQAIYGTVCFGIGGAVGSFYSGYSWTTLGPSGTFAIAALSAAIAFLIATFFVRIKD